MCSKSRVRTINIRYIQQLIKKHQLHPSSLIMQYHNGLKAMLELMSDIPAGFNEESLDNYTWVIEMLLSGLYEMMDEEMLTEQAVILDFSYPLSKNHTEH